MLQAYKTLLYSFFFSAYLKYILKHGKFERAATNTFINTVTLQYEFEIQCEEM